MFEVSGSGAGCQSGYRVVIYEAMTPQSGRSVVRSWLSEWIYRSGDLYSYDTPVWDVSVSDPGCQSGYRSGDL